MRNTAYIFDLAERVACATGIRLDATDIGGGLGVAYFDGEEDLDTTALAKDLNPLAGAVRPPIRAPGSSWSPAVT